MAEISNITPDSGELLGGLRMTKQRKVVYGVLVDEKRDHPTASEVFSRAKERMPSISLATVYNCLETLVHSGVVKQVNFDRDASRYCPNLQPHAHFYCSSCEEVFDINLKQSADAATLWSLPVGSNVEEVEVSIKGFCPDCSVSGGQ